MIKAILIFQFELNQKENGDIDPTFTPIEQIFPDEAYNLDNYNNLINESDLFGAFYQHTAGQKEVNWKYSNYYTGKLNKTSFQIMSFFDREDDGTQFFTCFIFDIDDEIEIFEEIIKDMGSNLENLFPKLLKAVNTKNLNLIEETNLNIFNTLKFTQFQIERLSNLDKLQKLGLIIKNKERRQILKLLYEYPRSRRELKEIIEAINPNANLDILLDPFLELNLIRRDWIKGERDKETGLIKNQGEYIFLIKDFELTLVPNEELTLKLRSDNPDLYSQYMEKIDEFLMKPTKKIQIEEINERLAAVLLNPDTYDFLALMRYSYYPLDKIPKILSEWADAKTILEELQSINLLTVVKDINKRDWVILQADIEPYFFFPEHTFPNIRKAYRDKSISYEVAKKALDLMEVTFVEKIEI